MEIDDYIVIDLHSGQIHKTHPNPSFVIYAATTIDKQNPLGGFGTHLKAQVDLEGRIFRLDHASIGLFFENGGAHSSHAITGIRCMNDGSPKLIDSNSDYLYTCDWSVPSNITRCPEYTNACMQMYHSAPRTPIILFVVYTTTTMSMNNMNNISPNKIINRYSRSMNVE